jgi:hypothetical protein
MRKEGVTSGSQGFTTGEAERSEEPLSRRSKQRVYRFGDLGLYFRRGDSCWYYLYPEESMLKDSSAVVNSIFRSDTSP